MQRAPDAVDLDVFTKICQYDDNDKFDNTTDFKCLGLVIKRVSTLSNNGSGKRNT